MDTNYIPYYLTIQIADSLYLESDFEKSYTILDSLFKLFEPLNTDTYAEYGIYLGSAVMSGHLKGISEKVKFGYSTFGFITTNHNDWEKIIDSVENAAGLNREDINILKKEYFEKLNLNLRKRLVRMYDEDQLVRNNRDKEGMLIYEKKHNQELEEILQNYGFPGNKIIGSNNCFPNDSYVNVYAFFLHQPSSFKDKYLPILLENVKKGNCDPKVYAIIFDRKMWESIDKQYYGTYTVNNGELLTLINPTKIDSIRKSIGLPNINYMDWKSKKLGFR